MNNCEIHNQTGLNIDSEIHSLVDFAKDRFKFNRPPSIFLKHDIQNSQKILGKTGYYDPETFEIHIYTTGRHPKDILRSIAHELVHHLQNEKGDLTSGGCNKDGWALACVKSDGNNDYMGPGYAQKNPKMREMERQAYEMGNLCLRDWEDLKKQNNSTNYNIRREHKMSLKEWKNNELGDLLTDRWGFKMNLSTLNEGEQKKNMVKGPDGKMVPDYVVDGEGQGDKADEMNSDEDDSKDKTDEPTKEEE